jgi:Dyp-type peroxidase family
MSTDAYRGSSDLALAIKQICQDGVVLSLAKLGLPYTEEYAAMRGDPVTVRMKVTVKATGGAGAQGSDEQAEDTKIVRDVTLEALDYGQEIDLWHETRELVAGNAPSAFTSPPYNWRKRWPTGRALITHLLENVVLRWPKVPAGREVVLDVSTRLVDGQEEVVSSSDYVAYVEDGFLPNFEKLEPKPNLVLSDTSLRTSHTIQGDILAGFKKPHEAFLLLTFGETKPERLRDWLGNLTSSKDAPVTTITDTETVTKDKTDREDPNNKPADAVWVNLGLTFEGIVLLEAELGEQLRQLKGPEHEGIAAFREGPHARAELLGDTDDNDPRNWEFGADGQPKVHALLTIAADTLVLLNEQVDKQSDLATSRGLKVVGEQRTDPHGPARGFEHFGFRDGVSQPGVSGYSIPAKDTNEDADHPGARIVPREQFILGDKPLSWMKDGSFQVFRRLAQDVRGWQEQVNSISGQLPIEDEMGPGLLAAKLMGRWPSGTPTALAPIRDYRAAYTDGDNPFEYRDDPEGFRTPLFAHIRVQNPRGKPDEDDQHRIIRRGVAYGPVYDPEDDDEDRAADKRGLLFNAYMGDLSRQFEHLQQKSNRPGRDVPDALLAGSKDKTLELRRIGSNRVQEFNFHRFVKTRGAVYAFAPSIHILKALAANNRKDLGLEDG